MSPDLSVAKIYLSMLMVQDKNETLKTIKIHTKSIRKSLGDKVKKQLRIVPEIVFRFRSNNHFVGHDAAVDISRRRSSNASVSDWTRPEAASAKPR